MGNRFFDLPVGSPGAGVDVSVLGAARTISLGGTFAGSCVIEISQDGTNWVPLLSFGAPGQQDINVAAARMRVNVVSGGGTPNVDVGGNDNLTTVVTALAVPAGNGSGAGSDVSGMGDVKTIVVTGAFTGAVIIEQSLDGANWSTVKSFQAAGEFTTELTAQQLRVTRNNAGGAVPVVSVGGSAVDPANRNEVVAPALTAQTTAALDTTVQCDTSGGAFVLDLPVIDAASEGARITVKKVVANIAAVTITPNAGAGNTIEGVATLALAVAALQCVVIESDGVNNWNLISQI